MVRWLAYGHAMAVGAWIDGCDGTAPCHEPKVAGKGPTLCSAGCGSRVASPRSRTSRCRGSFRASRTDALTGGRVAPRCAAAAAGSMGQWERVGLGIRISQPIRRCRGMARQRRTWGDRVRICGGGSRPASSSVSAAPPTLALEGSCRCDVRTAPLPARPSLLLALDQTAQGAAW